MNMLADEELCCGCGACEQICPNGCITMVGDSDGFLRPVVAGGACSGCGLCAGVCPALNRYEPRQPLKVLAARNPDEEIRRRSSSGGVFSMMAEKVVGRGGVVFGAAFDNEWNVVHKAAYTIDELSQFRGSKYVQSAIGDCFRQVKDLLDEGREVLFSGTSCQIAGLKHFLDSACGGCLPGAGECGRNVQESDAGDARADARAGAEAGASGASAFGGGVWAGAGTNASGARAFGVSAGAGAGAGAGRLLTVEIVCHGVPAPAEWRRVVASLPAASAINFRDKSTGWRNFSLTFTGLDGSTLLSEKCSENAFMQDFLHDRIIRESCFSCPARGGRSGSDIAIADYWGINKVAPELDDNMGVSLVLLETARGAEFFASLDFTGGLSPVGTTYAQALARNRSLESSPEKP